MALEPGASNMTNAADAIPSSAPQILQLADGRKLRFSELGTGDGMPVFALHGTPGSWLKFRGAHDAALAVGIRLIAVDRWGYGGTDAPHKSIARTSMETYGADLAALADALGLSRFGILAISGGGPFGAVTAAQLGPRIMAIALVCPVGPMYGAPPDGSSAFHRFCFNILPRTPGAIRTVFGGFRWLLRLAPLTAVQVATSRAAAADRALMAEPDRRRQLADTFTAGLAPGVNGPVIDMTLFSRPWHIAAPLEAPARMWIGLDDRNVPLPAARRLATMVGAQIVEMPGCGHYWIAQEWPEVLAWLANSRLAGGT